MSRALRIVHLIPGLANASGPTRVVLQAAEMMAERGHDVSIAALHGRLSEEPTHHLKGVRIQTFPAKRPRKWGYSPELRDAVRAHSPDLIHVHSLWCYTNILADRERRHCDTPVIVSPAGALQPYSLGLSRLRKRIYAALLESRQLRAATCLHALSEYEAAELRRAAPGTRVAVIPAAAKRRELLPPRKAADADRLVFLGRIHPIKGLELLPDVMSRVVAVRPTARLDIYGPGPETYIQELRQSFAAAGVQDAVRFHGAVGSAERSQILAEAALVLLPSHSENFAFTVLESLQAGTPVIAAEGTPWQVLEDHDAGALCPRNSEAFSVAILDFLEDSERLASARQQTQHLLESDFDWDDVAARLEAMYLAACCS